MQWEVSGADAKSGGDVTVTIDADDERSAISAAKNRGIYVSNLRRYVPPPPPSPAVTRAAEKYPEILAGNKWLNVAARMFVASGLVSICFAVPGIIAWIAPAPSALHDWVTFEIGFGASIGLLVSGIFQFVFAAFLRFTGAVGLAIRDAVIKYVGGK